MPNRYDQILKEFAETYDLSTMNSANDRTNLQALARNIDRLEEISKAITTIMRGGDLGEKAIQIKTLSGLETDLIEKNLQLERQLGIDRKSRKKDNETSPVEYITHLKQAAKEFLAQRLVQVYCPKCKILVMRFSAAYEHTEFHLGVQCPQCNKIVTAKRKEKDVFYDLQPRDRDWRKKYPMEVVVPKEQKEHILQDSESDMIIDDKGVEYGEDD